MSLIPKTVNPDLAVERQNASFDVEEFAAWFYGDANLVQMKRVVENEMYKDVEDPHELMYLSYEDMNTRAVKHAVDAVKKLKSLQERFNPGGTEIYPTLTGGPFGDAMMPVGNPFAVHFIMFTKILKGQGTTEQYEKFGKRADNCEIIGTYAQTELGHGTFLKGLETRADYDRKTDEFILNTPTLTAYKWWPGGLGHVANYCIVVAQLYIDNQPKGIQLFVLQVRDENTHRPLPGIDIGEIGKKIGMLAYNNGYLGLKNVRIPRTNMLMKNAQVLPNGEFIQSPKAQLNYMPMVYVRVMVSIGNAMLLAQSATITTRYSVVRRQSPIEPDAQEPKIMEHVTQQLKVLPEIANSIAYFLAGRCLFELYNKTTRAIKKNDYSQMQELHALACTLKASCSHDSAFGTERLRLACGGHGYLAAANLGHLFTLGTAAITYEGENTVLYLQVGKILIKIWADILTGATKLPATLSYLSEWAHVQKFPKWTGTWQCLVEALQYTATNKTRIAFNNYNARLKQGQTAAVAANNTGIELTQAAELHGRAFIANTFLQEVTGAKAVKYSANLRKVLENLLELYLVNTLLRHIGDVLRFINLSENDLADLQRRLEEVLKRLRPDAVAICDGFDFHDKSLNSVLGSYDGNVYERLFESAKKSPLNKQIVPKSYELHLKPFLKSNL